MNNQLARLVAWVALLAALIMILLVVVWARAAQAELCLDKIDNTIEKRGGFRWQWRTVDGRRCWFYSNTLLPREDLVWSYRSEDYDADVKVLGRKFYEQVEESGILELKERH